VFFFEAENFSAILVIISANSDAEAKDLQVAASD